MSIQITIKVSPGSSKQAFILDKSGQLKCFLHSAPEKGLANAELIKLLAHALGIAQSDIMIITGQTSRTKRLRINVNSTYQQLLSKLKIEQQKSLLSS